jgi:CheY-like chemotaxis protein
MMMPIMDGVQTLKKLRENSILESVSIILLTAKAQINDKQNFTHLPIT